MDKFDVNYRFHVKHLYRLLFFCAICLVIACQQPTATVTIEEGMTVKVLNSSGDDFSYPTADSSTYFLPYPLNFSKIDLNGEMCDVVILSKKLKKGRLVQVNPIAELIVENVDGVQSRLILCNPVDKTIQLVEEMEINGFNVKHFPMKHIIEYWYVNRYGLNGSKASSWRALTIEDFMNN